MKNLYTRIFGHSATTILALAGAILVGVGDYIAEGSVTKQGLMAAVGTALIGSVMKNPQWAWFAKAFVQK